MKLCSVDKRYSAVPQKTKKKHKSHNFTRKKITIATIDYLLLLPKTIQNIEMTKRLNRTGFLAGSS